MSKLGREVLVVEGGRSTDDPTGLQGDVYPRLLVDNRYRVGAAYKNKDELEIDRAMRESRAELRPALEAHAPPLTVDGAKTMTGGAAFSEVDLRECMPSLTPERARLLFPWLRDAMAEYGIDTLERAAQFLATLGHESADLRFWKEIGGENQRYAPWYGRGPIQITWRENYERIGRAIGADLIRNPDLLYKKEYGFRAAAAFFSGVNPQGRDLRVEADWGNFETIMWTVLGAVNHPSYYDRWNRYVRACRALPIPFSLHSNPGHKTNFERALAWMWPLIGKMPYGWWTSGIVPDGQPAFAVNAPVPRIRDLMNQRIFCVGPVSLARRHAGKVVPTAGDARYDGGTVACWAYWSRFLRRFDVKANYPHGTVVFRRFRNARDQGHVAIQLGNFRALQSFDGGEAMEGTTDGPGFNARYTLDASHAGGYYEYALLPQFWINHDEGVAPWAR